MPSGMIEIFLLDVAQGPDPTELFLTMPVPLFRQRLQRLQLRVLAHSHPQPQLFQLRRSNLLLEDQIEDLTQQMNNMATFAAIENPGKGLSHGLN